MTFYEACKLVVASCNNEYAKSYAQAGVDYNMTGHEAKVQALYILNNITHWRGSVAKEVRTELKRIGGVK
jgi:lysylphosphatidylglycerol synthetase-like protein (DUF2156 family)